MSITFNGIGSGLDIDSIVQAIVAAERAPADNRLSRLESATTEEISAVGQLNSALNTFLDAVEDLGDQELYQGRTVSVGDKDLVAVTADETAQTGSFQLQIEQIATAHKIGTQAITDDDTEVGSGTLTIHLGSQSFDIDVLAEANTLADVRDAINNAEDNVGVTASIVNDDTGARLVLTSNVTGEENTIAITATDDDGDDRDLAGLSQLVYDPNDILGLADGGVTHDGQELAVAQDAIVYVDGLTITRSSNTIEDVIDGVTIDLVAAQSSDDFDAGNTINVTVENDKSAIKNSINNFIDVFNNFMNVVEQLTLVVVSEGDSDNVTGALTGDSTVRNMVSTIRSKLSVGVDDNPEGLQFLVNLGISTDEDGLLTLDEEALDEALDLDFDAIGNLFSGDNGLSSRLEESLSGYSGSDGVLELRLSSLQNTLDGVDDDRDDLNERMELTEARLYAQYQAADALIGSLNNTLNYLTSALGGGSSDDE